MTTTTEVVTDARPLRWLADNFVQVQRVRIRVGEQIRAVLQGRDPTFVPPTELTDEEVAHLLKDIAKGDALGPIPLMGRSYHRHYEEERAIFDHMVGALDGEPAWYWLGGVRGIGPALGCYLLGLIDIQNCPYVSSLWKFAGLATVPGELYTCTTCGVELAFPVGTNVTGKHQQLGSTKKCKGTLEKVEEPAVEIRVAEPRAVRGQKRCYNAFLKSKVYLCATSFLKVGGPYEEFYRAERAKAEAERTAWREGRKHFLALRKTQKLFLSHLWQIWREEEDLPVNLPYAHEKLGHHDLLDPWDFTTAPKGHAPRSSPSKPSKAK
jgi:hypothetical protein